MRDRCEVKTPHLAHAFCPGVTLDHPGIHPALPPKPISESDRRWFVEPNAGTVWQTCWEYVVSHEMTDTERAAFWSAANLMHKAMARGAACGIPCDPDCDAACHASHLPRHKRMGTEREEDA